MWTPQTITPAVLCWKHEVEPVTTTHTYTVSDANELTKQLESVGYLADTGVSTVAYLALAMQRPVLLEGEPGTGKTALAEAMADAFDVPLIRLQCRSEEHTSELQSRGHLVCRLL